MVNRKVNYYVILRLLQISTYTTSSRVFYNLFFTNIKTIQFWCIYKRNKNRERCCFTYTCECVCANHSNLVKLLKIIHAVALIACLIFTPFIVIKHIFILLYIKTRTFGFSSFLYYFSVFLYVTFEKKNIRVAMFKKVLRRRNETKEK